MKNLSFKNYLITEMALHDYKTIGNFEKNSSFRDPRDRKIIQHPKAIERTRKKFGSTEYDFDFYFVNTPAANKHSEVGMVKPEWVKQNLGDEVYNAIEPNLNADHIQVIFTNNKGSERKNMTAWMMGHRIGHALARENGARSGYYYKEASDHLISQLSDMLQHYGIQEFPRSEKQISQYNSPKTRQHQLAMLQFFYEVATFKSARDRNIRDWFEILNEMIAQYLTTGKVKFNPAPKSFGNTRQRYLLRDDYEDVNDELQGLARDMTYMIDSLLGSVVNSVFVM
jgi:hypothetical protein